MASAFMATYGDDIEKTKTLGIVAIPRGFSFQPVTPGRLELPTLRFFTVFIGYISG